MDTLKLSNALHALSAQCGQLLIEAKQQFDSGKMPAPELGGKIREKDSKISGLCFATKLLLTEDEIHQLIYRTGITEEIFNESVAKVVKEVEA